MHRPLLLLQNLDENCSCVSKRCGRRWWGRGKGGSDGGLWCASCCSGTCCYLQRCARRGGQRCGKAQNKRIGQCCLLLLLLRLSKHRPCISNCCECGGWGHGDWGICARCRILES